MVDPSWLGILQNLGVPVSFCIAMGISIWRVGVWLTEHVMKPLVARHVAYLDAQDETARMNARSMQMLAETQRSQEASIVRIADTQEEHTACLTRISESQERLSKSLDLLEKQGVK